MEAALTNHKYNVVSIPVKIDGSKAPALTTWKPWQTKRPTRGQLELWFGADMAGIGVICGAISENLEMLEFEGRAVKEGVFREASALASASGLEPVWRRISSGWCEESPSGGVHFFYRTEERPSGNAKLASRPATAQELATWKNIERAKATSLADAERRSRLATIEETTAEKVPQVLIETRGEGGYVVVAPSSGAVHGSGKPWKLLAGGPATIPALTRAERTALWSVLRSLEAMPKALRHEKSDTPVAGSTGSGKRPGDAYNEAAQWADILEPCGWEMVQDLGDKKFWKRPGKDTPGISATTGYGEKGDWLYVFSTSTGFKAGTTYDKFAAYAVLHHNGDFAAAARSLHGQGFGDEDWTSKATTEGAEFTDIGNAERLAEVYGDHLRYNTESGQWLTWQEYRWVGCGIDQVTAYAMAVVKGLPKDDEAVAKHRKASQSLRAIKAMVTLAQSLPALQVTPSVTGEDPYSLATPSGVVNLRNGEVTPPDPAGAFHSRSTSVPYDTNMETPRWNTFISQICGGDEDLICYLQCLVGYSATGVTDSHILPFLHGPGGNGKSVLMDVITTLLGDYATSAPTKFLLAGSGQHDTEIARLAGQRMVVCSEVNPNQKFDEAKLKLLTGGDLLTARFMYRDYFTWKPTHHLWLMGNHQPRVAAGGESFWRRLRVIPFPYTVPADKRIPGLDAILIEEEGPGILAWIVAGAQMVLKGGLIEPSVVTIATDTYAEEEDSLARFLEDRVVREEGVRTPTADLVHDFKRWCQEEHEPDMTLQMFGREVRQRFGIKQEKSNGYRYYVGIRLRYPPPF